jgi:hypothetical protein
MPRHQCHVINTNQRHVINITPLTPRHQSHFINAMS